VFALTVLRVKMMWRKVSNIGTCWFTVCELYLEVRAMGCYLPPY